MDNFVQEILLNHEDIVEVCETLGKKINADYAGKRPILIGLLKGSVPFLAELIKHVHIDMELDFIHASSYVGTTSSGAVMIIKDMNTPVAGRHLILVEDIVDTGLTLSHLVKILRKRKPASIRVCAFLDKRERRRVPFQADYVGFSIPDHFVVGYGLDYDEKFRFLPDVCWLRNIV